MKKNGIFTFSNSPMVIKLTMNKMLRFTVFLQVFSEDVAGFSPFRGVVERNVSVDVLQQNVHPGLPDAGQKKAEETQTKRVLAGAIHQN